MPQLRVNTCRIQPQDGSVDFTYFKTTEWEAFDETLPPAALGPARLRALQVPLQVTDFENTKQKSGVHTGSGGSGGATTTPHFRMKRGSVDNAREQAVVGVKNLSFVLFLYSLLSTT